MEFSKVLSLSWLAIFFWSTISLYKGMHRGLFLNIPLSSNTPWGAQIQGSFVICCHVFKLCFSSLNTTCKKQPSERCNWNIQCYEMYFGTMKRVAEVHFRKWSDRKLDISWFLIDLLWHCVIRLHSLERICCQDT